jgi:hypothetical protein
LVFLRVQWVFRQVQRLETTVLLVCHPVHSCPPPPHSGARKDHSLRREARWVRVRAGSARTAVREDRSPFEPSRRRCALGSSILTVSPRSGPAPERERCPRRSRHWVPALLTFAHLDHARRLPGDYDVLQFQAGECPHQRKRIPIGARVCTKAPAALDRVHR